jgi:glycosyltransferase involved in cell wall biosynthesis
MPHLLWIANIPTPYRNHRYELMNQVFPDYGLTFEVLFMAWSEPGRYWEFDSSDLRYPHTVFPGLHARVHDVNLHFNPGLLRYLRKRKPEVAVIGGYSVPTLVAAPFVCPAKTKKLLGVESNIDSATYTRGLVRRLKQNLVRRYDGYVTPNERSRHYLQFMAPEVARKPVIVLPDIIDESFFVRDARAANRDRFVTREEIGIEEGTQLWLCVARLEDFKGLHIFLPLLEGSSGIHVIVAGEGSQRERLQSLITAQSLPVDLIGQVDAKVLRRLYAAVDLFVLPSLREPGGMSAVEAAASRLPLLLSNRVGNAPDLVVNGENGWIYDPEKPADFVPTLRAIASMTRQELEAMGQLSFVRYENTFDSVRCIERLAEGLIEISTGKPRHHE